MESPYIFFHSLIHPCSTIFLMYPTFHDHGWRPMRLAYDWGNKPPYTSYGSYGYQVAFGYQGELTTKSRCPKPWHLVFGIFPPSQNPPAFLGYPIHGNSHLTLIMMYCDIPSLSHINPIIFHHFSPHDETSNSWFRWVRRGEQRKQRRPSEGPAARQGGVGDAWLRHIPVSLGFFLSPIQLS